VGPKQEISQNFSTKREVSIGDAGEQEGAQPSPLGKPPGEIRAHASKGPIGNGTDRLYPELIDPLRREGPDRKGNGEQRLRHNGPPTDPVDQVGSGPSLTSMSEVI
jgi:hypothetical protein